MAKFDSDMQTIQLYSTQNQQIDKTKFSTTEEEFTLTRFSTSLQRDTRVEGGGGIGREGMTRVGMRGGEGGGGRKEEFLRVETSNASRSLTVHT